MDNIQRIKAHPVYKQVIRESFWWVMYNVANRDKYDSTELLQMRKDMNDSERSSADGIVAGVMNFLLGK